jgi:hypothetical protein
MLRNQVDLQILVAKFGRDSPPLPSPAAKLDVEPPPGGRSKTYSGLALEALTTLPQRSISSRSKRRK